MPKELTVKLHVWGPYACFTRPEMKVERVSYDVITPSAARGILDAIHWRPAIRWVIDRIHVLRPIRFEQIRRNEVSSKIPEKNVKAAIRRGSTQGLACYVDDQDQRQPRATLALRDVAYVIEAHVEMTERAGPEDNPVKHVEMFRRRASKGQCFHRPALGCREFAADFAWIDVPPPSGLPDEDRNRDLGWMLYDIDFANGNRPLFFRARLEDGIVDVARARREEGLVG